MSSDLAANSTLVWVFIGLVSGAVVGAILSAPARMSIRWIFAGIAGGVSYGDMKGWLLDPSYSFSRHAPSNAVVGLIVVFCLEVLPPLWKRWNSFDDEPESGSPQSLDMGALLQAFSEDAELCDRLLALEQIQLSLRQAALWRLAEEMRVGGAGQAVVSGITALAHPRNYMAACRILRERTGRG